jgi:hypothetical protein
MFAYRGYILTFAACFAAEFGIFIGLTAIGAGSELGVAVLMIWLCVTCVLTGLIGEHFYPQGRDDPGD